MSDRGLEEAARAKLAETRARLVLRFPYFAVAAFALRPVAQPGLGTFAVTRRWHLLYDPAVLAGPEAWGDEELVGALWHELNHLLRRHARRAELAGVDHLLWNLAADLEINDDVAAAGLRLIASAPTPDRFGLPSRLLAEEYLEKIPVCECSCHGGGGGAGEGEGDAAGGGGGEDRDGKGQGGGGCARCGDAPHVGVSCGSGASGGACELDEDGMGEAEAEIVRRAVAEKARDELRKGRGRVPAGLERWAEETLAPPAVDWRRQLAAEVRRAVAQGSGMVDYTYARPSRRQAATPVILPALTRPIPAVAVVLDTSGSMDDAELARALAEAQGVIDATCRRQAVPVLSVDAAVQGVDRVLSARRVRPRGGGGTDMGAGIEAALKLRPRPEVVVVLTDGLTPWPKTPPPCRVVIGLLGKADVATPDYARVVRIEV